MKKKMALLSFVAIFAFALTTSAQDTNTKTTQPTKKEVKAECKDKAPKGECKGEKKAECKGEKKADCDKGEKKACCGDKK